LAIKGETNARANEITAKLILEESFKILTFIINFLVGGLIVIYQVEFDIGVNSMHEPTALLLISPKDMEPPAQIGLGAPIEFRPVRNQ
jgi:hypothetical protein